tara:strand:- start:24076 stop:26265 length:2190 start_codon:yes stop_codon:yes gene_type:complete
MSYGINGTISFLLDPSNDSNSSPNRQNNYYYAHSRILSANQPIVYSILWQSGLITESDEPLASNYSSGDGDVINVLFDIYAVSNKQDSVFPADWVKIATIRKSRDIKNIANIDPIDGGDGRITNYGHKFTIDIGEVCKDLVSYSLIPNGKGTWNHPNYGGLNGGLKQQDNLNEPVWSNKFIQSYNGTYRTIRVQARTEILDSSGIVREATDSGSFKTSYTGITLLNNVFDPYNFSYLPGQNFGAIYGYSQSGWGTSRTYARQHQNAAPNLTYEMPTPSNRIKMGKEVRMTDTLEQLQWNQDRTNNESIFRVNFDSAAGETSGNANNTSDLIEDFYIEVTAFSESHTLLRNGRLFDWNRNLLPKTTINGVTGVWPRTQRKQCAQNVSPVFINTDIIHESSPVQADRLNGGTTYTRYRIDTDGASNTPADALFLNDEVAYYRVRGVSKTTTQGNGTGFEQTNMFEMRFYTIDRDMQPSSNDANTYAGVYYTELRSDATTNFIIRRFSGTIADDTTLPKYFKLHWLDVTGGISSYTCKENVTISYANTKDTILRKGSNVLQSGVPFSSGYTQYPYGTSTVSGSTLPSSTVLPNPYTYHIGDTLRGRDVHKGGVEVLSSKTIKMGTATTQPLNEVQAEWLRTCATSPNVWTEELMKYAANEANPSINSVFHKREAQLRANGGTIYGSGKHPTNYQMLPIVITNSEVNVYDKQKGYVTITFEFMYSHPVSTQRN